MKDCLECFLDGNILVLKVLLIMGINIAVNYFKISFKVINDIILLFKFILYLFVNFKNHKTSVKE